MSVYVIPNPNNFGRQVMKPNYVNPKLTKMCTEVHVLMKYGGVFVVSLDFLTMRDSNYGNRYTELQ